MNQERYIENAIMFLQIQIQENYMSYYNLIFILTCVVPTHWKT